MENKLKILLVEDEDPAAQRLEKHLDYQPSVISFIDACVRQDCQNDGGHGAEHHDRRVVTAVSGSTDAGRSDGCTRRAVVALRGSASSNGDRNGRPAMPAAIPSVSVSTFWPAGTRLL